MNRPLSVLLRKTDKGLFTMPRPVVTASCAAARYSIGHRQRRPPDRRKSNCATCAILPASCTPTTNVTRCLTATPWARHDHGGHRLICCPWPRSLAPAGSITPLTFHYILGLIAATGLRRSEATSLLLTDLTADGLLIRKAKFGKRRLVPLDGSVHRSMDAYLRERKRCGGPDDHLFVLSTGRPMHPVYLATVFVKLARRVGLRAGPGQPGPRLHDLRHGFAVRALESTLSAERRDVARHMLTLSTYLGHSNTADTYWYLEATPVLLRQVSQATERLHEGRKNDG